MFMTLADGAYAFGSIISSVLIFLLLLLLLTRTLLAAVTSTNGFLAQNEYTTRGHTKQKCIFMTIRCKTCNLSSVSTEYTVYSTVYWGDLPRIFHSLSLVHFHSFDLLFAGASFSLLISYFVAWIHFSSLFPSIYHLLCHFGCVGSCCLFVIFVRYSIAHE